MPTDVERWKSEVYGDDIRTHLFEFAESGFDTIPDDERDAWFERFKWWGLYHQRNGQEGYFMMRIGTPNGVLKPGQLQVIGEIADEYARGPGVNPIFGASYADFTTRQSISTSLDLSCRTFLQCLRNSKRTGFDTAGLRRFLAKYCRKSCRREGRTGGYRCMASY